MQRRLRSKLAIRHGFASAIELLPKKFANDPSIFPPQKVMDSGTWQDEVGEASVIYDEYFQKLKVNN